MGPSSSPESTLGMVISWTN